MPGGLPLIKSETYMETVLGHADYCDIHKHYYFSKLNLRLPRSPHPSSPT